MSIARAGSSPAFRTKYKKASRLLAFFISEIDVDLRFDESFKAFNSAIVTKR